MVPAAAESDAIEAVTRGTAVVLRLRSSKLHVHLDSTESTEIGQNVAFGSAK
jgi:hypothetical protein